MDNIDNLELAQNVETSPEILAEIAEKGTSLERAYVALNPNTPTSVLIRLANKYGYLNLVLINPVMDLLILENPNILFRLNSLKVVEQTAKNYFQYWEFIINRCLETQYDYDTVLSYIIHKHYSWWEDYKRSKLAGKKISLQSVEINKAANFTDFIFKSTKFNAVTFKTETKNFAAQQSEFNRCVWGDSAFKNTYIDHHLNWSDFYSCLFKEAILKDCQFAQHSRFSGCDFNNVIFQSCDFSNSRFDLSRLVDVQFIDCTFVDTRWVDTILRQCRFVNPKGDLPPGFTAS